MDEILNTFGDLKDPRGRIPARDLPEMLVVALWAILAEADSWLGIELWAQSKLDWLRHRIELKTWALGGAMLAVLYGAGHNLLLGRPLRKLRRASRWQCLE
jgi:hypothetical protein